MDNLLHAVLRTLGQDELRDFNTICASKSGCRFGVTTKHTDTKMKIMFVEIRIFGSKVIFFNFLSYYIDCIVGSTPFFFLSKWSLGRSLSLFKR